MDNLGEEVEIKIEYNESFEVDPLSEKNIDSSKSNTAIENINTAYENNQVSRSLEIAEMIPKCMVKETQTEKNIDCSVDNTLHSYNNYSGNSTTGKLTWYDSIDNSGRFLCKFCDLKYSTLQSLRFHVKSKHSEHASHIKENLIKHKRSRKLKCHICKQLFKEIMALKSHVLKTHSLEDIKTSCLYCDAVFTTESDMSEHLFVHHNQTIYKSTYICNVCGYRTSTKSHYNQHRNTHTHDKTKKCQYCDYVTNYLPNLKIHERIHTNDKRYVCNFMNCSYQCSAKSALRSHQMKHNPDNNVLYCDKCSYKTVYRQCLKRHEDCHKRNSIKLKVY